MPGSAVVAAKTSLVTLLAARGGLAGVQVTYGWPGDDTAQRERVFTANARGTQDPASLRSGRTYRDEEATFDVVVQVELVGGTPAEADARTLVIGLEVEECVADNRTLGGVPGVTWAVMAGWTQTGFYNERGSLSEITYTVRYKARLT